MKITKHQLRYIAYLYDKYNGYIADIHSEYIKRFPFCHKTFILRQLHLLGYLIPSVNNTKIFTDIQMKWVLENIQDNHYAECADKFAEHFNIIRTPAQIRQLVYRTRLGALTRS